MWLYRLGVDHLSWRMEYRVFSGGARALRSASLLFPVGSVAPWWVFLPSAGSPGRRSSQR
jgi:hypothetical protein